MVCFLPGGESTKKKGSITSGFTKVKSEAWPSPVSSFLPISLNSRIWGLLFMSLTRAERVWGKWEMGTRDKLVNVGWKALDIRLHFGLYLLAVRPLGGF